MIFTITALVLAATTMVKTETPDTPPASVCPAVKGPDVKTEKDVKTQPYCEPTPAPEPKPTPRTTSQPEK